MNVLTVVHGNIELRLTGLDVLLSLKRKIVLPLQSVTSVGIEDSGRMTPPLLRSPGTYVPRLITAGTFRGNGHQEFWNVRRAEQCLVIDLTDHKYTRLVLGMPLPRAQAVQAEIAASSSRT